MSKRPTARVQTWRQKFYVVKYDEDGVIEVKDDAEVEFKDEIPIATGRDIDDFRVGDEVMAMWMDGRRYAAVVMKVGENKKDLQKECCAMKRITRKRTSKNHDFIKLRKKAQLQRLSELQSDLHISSQVTIQSDNEDEDVYIEDEDVKDEDVEDDEDEIEDDNNELKDDEHEIEKVAEQDEKVNV